MDIPRAFESVPDYIICVKNDDHRVALTLDDKRKVCRPMGCLLLQGVVSCA